MLKGTHKKYEYNISETLEWKFFLMVLIFIF